jgi:hypothetical protein
MDGAGAELRIQRCMQDGGRRFMIRGMDGIRTTAGAAAMDMAEVMQAAVRAVTARREQQA